MESLVGLAFDLFIYVIFIFGRSVGRKGCGGGVGSVPGEREETVRPLPAEGNAPALKRNRVHSFRSGPREAQHFQKKRKKKKTRNGQNSVQLGKTWFYSDATR